MIAERKAHPAKSKAIRVVELFEGAEMRSSVFKLSILMLLAFSLAVLCRAQQTTEAGQRVFPIVRGNSHDGLPRKLIARGTVSRIAYAPPRSCGALIFVATIEIKLDAQVKGYKHPFLYLVVPCLYQPAGAQEGLLNQGIEITATKQDETARPCFFDIKTSAIDSGGLPFYCAKREELLRAAMREPVSSLTEPVEFAGALEKGVTYRALVTRDEAEQWRLVLPLKLPYHHAGRVEWLNLRDFPALNTRPSGALLKRIVFKVTERTIVKVSGQYRWNTTYDCHIIAIEEAASLTLRSMRARWLD